MKRFFLLLSIFVIFSCETQSESTQDNNDTISHNPGNTYTKGRQIIVDEAPFYIKGVCWNPVGIGKTHPQDLDYSGFADQDIALMAAAGINTIRTYEPLTDRAVLDKLHTHGIYVINTVYPWGGNAVSTAATHVKKVKDHPAILMWCIGNEWNYNGIYFGLSTEQSLSRLNQVAEIIKKADSTHPIATIYGGIPSTSTINRMPNIDVWGLNIYSGLNFGNTFNTWKNYSGKPIFMAEYGADAWNARNKKEDTEAQALATKTLTQLLIDNSAVANPENVCSGGTIFEWADEWWKDKDPNKQDIGGIAPGGGPYPDSTFNEEYWGIVDMNRNPRPAYYELQALFSE